MSMTQVTLWLESPTSGGHPDQEVRGVFTATTKDEFLGVAEAMWDARQSLLAEVRGTQDRSRPAAEIRMLGLDGVVP